MKAVAGRQTGIDDQNLFPSWSPDGGSIVFVSDRDGNFEIYVMNADGSNQRRLTNNPAEDIAPSWSPDGRYIAFASNRGGSYQIYLMDAAGQHVTPLTTSGSNTSPVWTH